jgi:choline dehydrogenase-like flavoprotein
MYPRFENTIRLDANLHDAWGVPALHINCTHSSNEVKMAADIRRQLRALSTIAGLQESKMRPSEGIYTPYGALIPGSSIHEVGGARMGRSPSNSVVNDKCQCWECDNVFVVDGACFPYLPFQNPTLTMMAIADRASQFIVTENSTTQGAP